MKRKVGDIVSSIDWGKDSNGNKRSAEDCVPVRVGDGITWMDRCRWRASAGRCAFSAGLKDMCSWHYDCLSVSGIFSEDYQAFSDWYDKNTDFWSDRKQAFEMVCGRFDPHDDRRFEAVNRKPISKKRYAGADIRQTMDALAVIKNFLKKKDPEKAKAEMGALAEKYPGNAAGFLILGRELEKTGSES